MDLIIGIPSYNRPKKLRKLIKKLQEIIIDNTEILVIENHSKNMLKEKGIKQKNTKYIKKKSNQGFDNSVIELLTYAKRNKKKIWFICDDDELYPKNILPIIEKIKKSTGIVDYVDWVRTNNKYGIKNKFDAYIRMSFLPSIVVNPEKLKLKNIKQLISCNYIQIAIINSLIDDVNDINLINIQAGQQKRNTNTRFPIIDTFIDGYRECLKYEQVLDDKILELLIFERVYASINYIKYENFSLNVIKKYLFFCLSQKNIKFFLKLKFLIKLIFFKWI